MAPTCVSGNFDEEFCDLMAENLRSHGIELAFGEKVLRLEGEDGKVARVVTDKGTHQADLVCLCIGFKPNTALFAGAGFDTLRNGALLVDHHQETSRRGVYAVGDCSSCYSNAKDGEPAYIALATNAVRSGIVAGHNACGMAIEGVGVQGSSGICIYDLKMVATGQSPMAAARKAGYDACVSDFSQVQKATFVETENPEVKIRVVFDGTTRRVLGAQMAVDLRHERGHPHVFAGDPGRADHRSPGAARRLLPSALQPAVQLLHHGGVLRGPGRLGLAAAPAGFLYLATGSHYRATGFHCRAMGFHWRFLLLSSPGVRLL